MHVQGQIKLVGNVLIYKQGLAPMAPRVRIFHAPASKFSDVFGILARTSTRLLAIGSQARSG